MIQCLKQVILSNQKEMEIKKIILPKKDSWDDGSLTFFEGNKDIPFEIKRVYYIYNTKNPQCIRWKHAHYETDQVMFVLKWSLRMVFDDWYEKQEIVLNQPNEWLLIPKMIWHTMDQFTEDCIALVVASSVYDEKDYIRNYEDFLNAKWIK